MAMQNIDPMHPDNFPPEFLIPAILILLAIYFVMGSKERREKRARKARLKK